VNPDTRDMMISPGGGDRDGYRLYSPIDAVNGHTVRWLAFARKLVLAALSFIVAIGGAACGLSDNAHPRTAGRFRT